MTSGSNQGLSWGTEEWRKQYSWRNTIESRNDLLKNGRGGGLGDQTARLMRGFAGQLLAVLIGVCVVNIALIDNWLVNSNNYSEPLPPLPPLDEDFGEVDTRVYSEDDPNAPPLAA